MRTEIKTKTWEELRSSARRILPAVVLSVGAVLGLGVHDVNAESRAWGPERPTYTWQTPADHVTFNSITDNPSIGDERNFVRIKKYGTNDKYRDSIDLEVGAEYEVGIWYHNDASANLNASGKGMANNVRLRMEAPGKVNGGHAGEIKGIISSTNATPVEVWDTAYVHTKSTVLLRYVANSATLHNHGTANGQILSSEAMFGKEGAKLAHSINHWGDIPGCNEYAGYVTYRFKVDQAAFDISKTVSKEKDANYVEKITVKPGEVLDFKIDYKNTGTINQQSIIAYDHMPKGLNYVSGTSFFKTSFNATGNFVSDKLFNGGINLGDFAPNDSMSLTYKVEVSKDEKIFPCGDTKVYNNASIATANGTGYDKVEITVHRDCKTEPKELPKTGPTEVMLAMIIATGVGVGGAYYFASRKQLKKLTENIK
jgi:conserved repeat protein